MVFCYHSLFMPFYHSWQQYCLQITNFPVLRYVLLPKQLELNLHTFSVFLLCRSVVRPATLRERTLTFGFRHLVLQKWERRVVLHSFQFLENWCVWQVLSFGTQNWIFWRRWRWRFKSSGRYRPETWLVIGDVSGIFFFSKTIEARQTNRRTWWYMKLISSFKMMQIGRLLSCGTCRLAGLQIDANSYEKHATSSFRVQDGGSTLLRNVGTCLPIYMASYVHK